MLESIDRI